jgi:hypothetical protein
VLYQQRKFPEAVESLARDSAIDAPSRVLLERCLAWAQTPPAEDWNGAYQALEK